jgi:geranylgeranyl pyrophosphate synthase
MVSDFLESIPSDILLRAVNLDLKVRSVNAHEAIDSVLSRSVLKGGKRLRPLLTYLMSNLFKVNLDDITPFARSTELVHAASLSHDDVIDNATIRRGTPSINILASNKKAVLAGDYLLSSVIVDLTQTGRLDLVKEMSLVIKDLSEGEWLQLDLISTRDYTRELIKEIALKKTSSVMSYCTLAPAMYSQAPKIVQDHARDLGLKLGLAFQLIDDTLDFSGDSLKDQQLDLQNGVVNAVVFEYLDANSEIKKMFMKGENLSEILLKADLSMSILIVTELAHSYLEEARVSLNEIKKYLSESSYKNDESNLNNAIELIELIFAYLVLRKN